MRARKGMGSLFRVTGDIQDLRAGALSGACNQVFSSGFISQLTAVSTGDRIQNFVSVSTDVYVFLCPIMPWPYGSVH